MSGKNFLVKKQACAALLLLGLIGGCQTAPVVPLVEPPPPPPPAPIVVPEPEPLPVPLATELKSVIELMQNGEAQLASDSLVAMIADHPSPKVMKALLLQLQTDSNTLFGDDFYEITVRAGDTLSDLADQHLSDPLQFYALAKYNDIAIPRLLEVNQRLKIPIRRQGDFNDQRSELERIGTYLIASGDTDAAWKALLQAADSGNLSVPGQQELFDLSMSIADGFIQSDQFELAVDTLEQTAARFEAGTYHTDLQARLIRLKTMAVEKTAAAVQQ